MIGNLISSVRKAKNITQDQLAELSNVNLRTIQRIESNENIPRGNTLKLICDALEIEIPTSERTETKTARNAAFYVDKMMNYAFLTLINLALMTIFGYLFFDNWVEIHSICGAVLLSFFMPAFIVSKTLHMSGLERTLKFGAGFILYIPLIISAYGFPTAFKTGFMPTLSFFLLVLYYGHLIYPRKE